MQLYKENYTYIGDALPISTGQNSIALGSVTQATGNYSIALGAQSEATAIGSCALGAGRSTADYAIAIGNGAHATRHAEFAFATRGNLEGKMSLYGLKVIGSRTTDATQTTLGCDGSHQFDLAENSVVVFTIRVSARRTDVFGENDAWEYKGFMHKDATAGTTTLDALQENHFGATGWNVVVDAEVVGGSLRVRVTGEAGKTIQWYATINASENIQTY